MLQQIEENPLLFALLFIAVVVVAAIAITSRIKGGNAKSSDLARILQCSFHPSAASLLPAMITRMSDGMAAPVGTLRMTLGTPPFKEIPESADVKLLIIDEKKNIFEASKKLEIKKDEIIGVIDAPFPIKPYDPLICRAWVVAAYYSDGHTWINENAAAYELKNRKFMTRKLSKI